MNVRTRMPLVECFALVANHSDDVSLLKNTDRYVRKYMAIMLEENAFSAEHASLEQWNGVLKAFDAPIMDSPEHARSALMNLLNA